MSTLVFFIFIFGKVKIKSNFLILYLGLIILIILSLLSLIRQLGLTGIAQAGDFGFFAKLIILFLSLVLGSMIKVDLEIAKKATLFSLILIIACTLLQYVIPQISFIYNNSNLIQQGRYGSFGITHYEATSMSIILCGFYLSLKLKLHEKLQNKEGIFILLSPMLTSVLSMSKAAIIICILWFVFCFLFYKNKVSILALLVLFCIGIFFAFNNYILVLYYGLSDLTKISTTQNLSIITRIEDLYNFRYIFENHNLFFLGIGPNRASYFHYFEIGVLSNAANIGFIGLIMYYFILLFLCRSMFTVNKKHISIMFFVLLLFADFLVNFNDGVKSLFLIGFLGGVSVKFFTFKVLPFHLNNLRTG